MGAACHQLLYTFHHISPSATNKFVNYASNYQTRKQPDKR